MDLNKEDIKALSADTRIAILKSLSKRRKMPAELAKQFSLAPSTINEHLKHLEVSKLVIRKNTGHKWIYYELTEKGSNLLAPKFPINLVLSLAGGIIFVAGLLYQFLPKTVDMASRAVETATKSAADISTLQPAKVQEMVQIDTVTTILVIIGAALIGFGLYRRFRKLN
ncbi:MAG: winged helix-turn-helix transcriptional regulator [Candidatus Aenigmarchaeota archaeon]|nr:winged helix-turn-helix transcriptional regulator [Candidatus Aenigmarchaeota archaeon]